MCQGTEERGQILQVHEMAEENLTQTSMDDKQLFPSCLAASVWHFFTISAALGSCQQPPGFGLVFVKVALSLCTHRFLTAAFTCQQRSLCHLPPGKTQGLSPFQNQPDKVLLITLPRCNSPVVLGLFNVRGQLRRLKNKTVNLT